MATIGTFSQKDGKWTGTIRTMTINVKAQMVPVTDKAEAGLARGEQGWRDALSRRQA